MHQNRDPDRTRKPNASWSLPLKAPPTGIPRTLADLMTTAEYMADRSLREIGKFHPTLLILGKDGPLIVHPDGFADEQAKDAFMTTARLLCIAQAATCVVMALEAWATFPKPGHPFNPQEMPSESLERKELVILIGESRGKDMQKCLPIVRTDAGGFFGFGEDPLPKGASVAGRFAKLLPPLLPNAKQQRWAQEALKVMGFKPPPSS